MGADARSACTQAPAGEAAVAEAAIAAEVLTKRNALLKHRKKSRLVQTSLQPFTQLRLCIVGVQARYIVRLSIDCAASHLDDAAPPPQRSAMKLLSA